MNWTHTPGTENPPGIGHGIPSTPSAQPPRAQETAPVAPGQLSPGELRVGKSVTLAPGQGPSENLEIFTLTLSGETIELLPFKNWGQLDHFKWTVRGKLPREPAGLEITLVHVKLMGETVLLQDTAGCAKLERIFNEWLAFEKQTETLARRKHAVVAPAEPAAGTEDRLQFLVELDKLGQVHVHCRRGRDTLASIGLTLTGFHSLYQQGLMRKPGQLQTAALHDWVQLDGELFSFEHGRNDAARLEQWLNTHYVPPASAGLAKEVAVYVNAASSTGFDIQFPVLVAGVPDHRRHHLDDRSLELLQDAGHCGLLHPDIIVKLVPPNLVLKQKTPDGGEQHLAWVPENIVTVVDEAGGTKTIPLSQPMNLLRLTAAELTAVFNHPAINRHSKFGGGSGVEHPEPHSFAAPTPPAQSVTQPSAPALAAETIRPESPTPTLVPIATVNALPMRAPPPPRPLPNLWLKNLLVEPGVRQDWLACLVYSKMAQYFGNSTEGTFGPCACWFIKLAECEDVNDAAFKGVFLTERGSLGYVNAGRVARFCKGVAFLGAREAPLEGIEVPLVAVGLDTLGRIVFVVRDNYHGRFTVTEPVLDEELHRLRRCGVLIAGVGEILASEEALEIVWTVPAQEQGATEPEALETFRSPERCSDS